jgi:RNA polymerase sigma-70 factor (ECF subfamily)
LTVAPTPSAATPTAGIPLDPARARRYVEDAYEQLHREIYAFAVHACRDEDAGADITQEAFLRLLVEAERHGPPVAVKAWLLRVATNLVISRGRHASVVGRFLARSRRLAPMPSPESSIEGREHRDAVHAMLGHISPDARAALLLAAEGYTGREIATILGRTEAATRVLMCRARLRLRELLSTPTSVGVEA